MTLQKALRTAQQHLPGGRDRRETFSRVARRLRGHPHEADFKALFCFPAKQLFLDVGGNYGQSIASMRLIQPDATIISYEPNSTLADKVAKLFSRDRHLIIRPYGLSDKSGTFDLFMPFYRNFPYPGLASLDETEASSWLSSDTLYFFRPEKLRIVRLRCRLETLDHQALAPYLIKIDVQGAEFNVLYGGRETLARHQPVLLIETPARDPKIAALLTPLGYVEFEFLDNHFVRRPSRGNNSFFLTKLRQNEIALRNPELFRGEMVGR